MTAKEYLRQLPLFDMKIQQKVNERNDLMLMATCTGSLGMDPNKVQTSIAGDKMSEAVSKYVDKEAEINQMIDEYVDLKDKIINEIHQLTDVRYVELLYLRYVPDVQTHRVKRLEEIACIMKRTDGEPYSFDHIARLHGQALEDFGEKVLGCHSNAKL